MSFLEKSAWVTFFGILIVYGGYIFSAFGADGARASMSTHLGLMLGLTVVIIGGHVIAALTKPSDAGAPQDERDKAITHKSDALAGNLGIAGCLIAAATGLAGMADAVKVANYVILAVVVAELIRYGGRIAAYRGWIMA